MYYAMKNDSFSAARELIRINFSAYHSSDNDLFNTSIVPYSVGIYVYYIGTFRNVYVTIIVF